jgi:hypothetical protein
MVTSGQRLNADRRQQFGKASPTIRSGDSIVGEFEGRTAAPLA